MKGIAQHVVFLRELGLSFRQIAKIVYNRSDGYTILKVYGIYRTYLRRRYNASSHDVISKRCVISESDKLIVESINYYQLNKLYDDHFVSFAGDLQEERIRLARMLGYVKDESRRKEIYRRLNRVKLLELIFAVYDLIGLSKHDNTRMYLSMLYSVAKKLVDRVDLDKDGVKRTSSGIRYLNGEAAAFVYVVFFVVLHNTPYSHLLDRINEIVYSLMSERRRAKKIEKIKEIITRKYSDVLADVIVRL